MGFLRQNKDGTTSLKILLHSENEGPEKVVTLGDFTGRLTQGKGQLQGFREDRRNTAKMSKPLNYGPFSSFAPVYDSRFSNLSKEGTDLVLETHGGEVGAQYTDSILLCTRNSSYASALANGLLDLLAQDEHHKTMSLLHESKMQRHELNELNKKKKYSPTQNLIQRRKNSQNTKTSKSTSTDYGRYQSTELMHHSWMHSKNAGGTAKWKNTLKSNYGLTCH